MIFDSTLRRLTLVSDAAATTTEPEFVLGYVDVTSMTYRPGTVYGTLTGDTPIVALPAPAPNSQRVLKSGSVTNVDTVAHDITITYQDDVVSRTVAVFSLDPGETVWFTEDEGWNV